jgi:hypothetical protein
MVDLGARDVLFGGASHNELLNDVWVFNRMSSTWSSYTSEGNCLSPRYFHAAAKVSVDSFVISGGLSNFTSVSSSVSLSDSVLIRFDSQRTFHCTPLSSLPRPLYGHSMCSTARGIILFGGFTRPDTGSSHVWLLRNSTLDVGAEWRLLSVSGEPPSPRAFFVSGLLASQTSANEILVIWGGISTRWEIQTPLFTLSYDDKQPAELGWTWSSPVLKGVPPAPRAYAATSYTSKTLCVHGGQAIDGVVLQDLWFLDRDIAGFFTWKMQSMKMPAPSVWGHSLSVFESGNQIYFYGGKKPDGFIEHRMVVYVIGSGEVSFVDVAGSVPPARHSAVLSCHGSSLILHGGLSGDSKVSMSMNDVWQFDFLNAQWSPLFPSQVPASNQSNSSLISGNATDGTNSSLHTSQSIEAVPRLFGHSMFPFGPILVVFGGYLQLSPNVAASAPVSHLYFMSPRLGVWQILQPPPRLTPSARAFHAHAVSPSSSFSSSASFVIFGGIGIGDVVLGDAWVIPLSLFQQRHQQSANTTDRMIAFDFHCRFVSFGAHVLQESTSFTVSFWLFSNVIPKDGQVLIGSASQSAKSIVEFSIFAMPQSCTLQVLLSTGSQVFITTGRASVCDVGWHYIAFTFDAASRLGLLYFDGVLDARLSVTATQAPNPFHFGSTFYIGHLPLKSSPAALDSCWSGFIDRFSFWNFSLTHDQISASKFNYSRAYIIFDFDSVDIFTASTKSSGLLHAFASLGGGNFAQAPALLPSSCPTSQSDLMFNFTLQHSWMLLPSGPSNRSHAMMTAVTSSDAVLFGGSDAAGLPLSDIWILRNFDVSALARWEFVVPVKNSGTPISHGIISALGQFQVVVVGYNYSSDAQVSLLADLGGYEKVLARQYFDVGLPPAMGVAHCKCIDNSLWAFGGQDVSERSTSVPFDGLFHSDMTSSFVPMLGSGFSPPPMLHARYCYVDSNSFLLIGHSPFSNSQESYFFTVSAQAWNLLHVGSHIPIIGSSLVSIQLSGHPVVIAFGGLSPSQEISSDVVLINIHSRISPRVISAARAPNCSHHGAISYSGMMWIFGGQTSIAPPSYSNQLWSFSPHNLSWALVAPASSIVPPPTIKHIFHSVGSRAVVVGGLSMPAASAALVPNTQAWVFDFSTLLWSSAAIPKFLPCVDMAAASHNQYLFVYGGLIWGSDQASSTVWFTNIYGNVSTWKWNAVPTTGPIPRSNAFLGVMMSNLVLYGGWSDTAIGLSLTDMWQYGIHLADPKFSRVFGPNSKVAYAGALNYFDIELRNLFNDTVANSAFNIVDFWLLYVGNSTRFRGSIEHRSDTIRIIFNPQYVGAYLAFLELNQGTISLSGNNEPFPISVLASAEDAASSDFHLLFPNGSSAYVDNNLLVAAGEPLLFRIIFQDKLKNSGEYLGRVSFEWFKVKIVPGTENSGNPVEYLDSTATPPVEYSTMGSGAVLVSGTLLEVANYSIIVKMGNSLIGAVTYNFTLLSAALDPRSSVVLLEESTSYETASSGVRKYPIGETVRIVVLLRDRFGNNITYQLEDNFFVARVISSDVAPVELSENTMSPLPEDVQKLLSAGVYENDAFSLVLSDVVIEGVLLPKRIIRFFPFSIGDYQLHLATSDGIYISGASVCSCVTMFYSVGSCTLILMLSNRLSSPLHRFSGFHRIHR